MSKSIRAGRRNRNSCQPQQFPGNRMGRAPDAHQGPSCRNAVRDLRSAWQQERQRTGPESIYQPVGKCIQSRDFCGGLPVGDVHDQRIPMWPLLGHEDALNR